MRIHANREACCSQDDQLGPLDRWYEVRDGCTLGDFVAAVMASRFLQFSSTHTTMLCRMGGKEAATVFSPYLLPARAAVYALPTETPVRDIASSVKVDFTFVGHRTA